MRRFAFVVVVVMALAGTALGCAVSGGRLPKPVSSIERQRGEHHQTAALHESRGPSPQSRGLTATPADQDRDKRRTHGIREE